MTRPRLVHRAEPVDPVTALREAQHRGLLDGDLAASDLMALVSTPVGSAEYWVNVSFNAPCRPARATALRTCWQRSTVPTPPTAPRAPRSPAVSRAGPPPRATTAGTQALR